MLPGKFSSSDTIKICVLLSPPPVQLLDLAPVDVFYMLSSAYLGSIELLPQTVKALAITKLGINYVFDDYHGTDQNVKNTVESHATALANLTADLRINAMPLSLASGVDPGDINILYIPGPDPGSTPSEICSEFIRKHAASGTTDIITICTGIYPACYAGICDGRTVTGPRGLLSDLGAKFQNVTFVEKRWSRTLLGKPPTDIKDINGNGRIAGSKREAELWTAAGITNGHDTVAAYLREHFDPELAAIICRMCDIGDREHDYKTGKLVESAWWISKIMKATVKQLLKL